MLSPRILAARRWYAVYCYLNGLVYVAVVIFFSWVFGERERVGAGLTLGIEDVGGFVGQVSVLLILMFGMCAWVCVWLPGAPRTRNWWVIHFVNLVLGAGSCVFTPVCLYLMWAFLQPDVRAYYEGRSE